MFVSPLSSIVVLRAATIVPFQKVLSIEAGQEVRVNAVAFLSDHGSDSRGVFTVAVFRSGRCPRHASILFHHSRWGVVSCPCFRGYLTWLMCLGLSSFRWR